MFTGLIEACVEVLAWDERSGGGRLVLPAGAPDWELTLGESVAVSGACLSVVEHLDPETLTALPRQGRSSRAGAAMAFDVSPETIGRTWFGELRAGMRVNLERALRLSDRIGGHLVLGHVDGQGHIVAIRPEPSGGRSFEFELPPDLSRYLIEKGSIAIDGISLTVVGPRAGRFSVAVIPTTLETTQLGTARVGQVVNVEVDVLGKWVEKLMNAR